MRRVFIDSDIILDILMAREPYYTHSAQFFTLIEVGEIQGHVSPLIFANLHYVLRRIKSSEDVVALLRKLRVVVQILTINERIIDLALSSYFEDFEDAIQYYTAIENDMDCIITRNKSDYKKSKIPVYTAEEYLDIKVKNVPPEEYDQI